VARRRHEHGAAYFGRPVGLDVVLLGTGGASSPAPTRAQRPGPHPVAHNFQLIGAFENLLTVNEICILALLTVMVCAGLSTLLERRGDKEGQRDWLAQTRAELRAFLSTMSFLSSAHPQPDDPRVADATPPPCRAGTVVVQLSVVLVRGTVVRPFSRVLTGAKHSNP
jgi:hypothetical protein